MEWHMGGKEKQSLQNYVYLDEKVVSSRHRLHNVPALQIAFVYLIFLLSFV